jgi:hypothetical protein
MKPTRRRHRPRARAATALLWCLSLASQAQTPPDPYSYSRTSDFSYRADGLLSSETIEPTQPQLCVVTTYDYDAYGVSGQ